MISPVVSRDRGIQLDLAGQMCSAALISVGPVVVLRWRSGAVSSSPPGLDSGHGHKTWTSAGNTLAVFEQDLADNLWRQLRQNALYTGTADLARQAAAASGFTAWDLESLDVEPGLGNGGLGRLAACLLGSLATLDLPAVGYGIRYEFGIFQQAFENGHPVERPDDWTFYGNPREFPAADDLQVVGFYGHTEAVDDDQGGLRARWVAGETARGEPSHMLVPGYGTETVNIIRLWRALAGHESFVLGLFNDGRSAEAVKAQMRSENLTTVVYPSDSTEAGRELRLKQQYLLVSCSLRDIIRWFRFRFRFRFRDSDWAAFPDRVVIQLNDTRPVLAIPQLMRLLVDENGVGWEQAWSITPRTCHTLLDKTVYEVIYEARNRRTGSPFP
jgi:glycogen phosphorylase